MSKPTKPPEDRLDRIERTIESLAEEQRAFAQEQRAFQATVRGAFTVQQQQIADLQKATEALQKTAESHERQIAEDRDRLNQLIEHWQAYLNTIHPKQ
jgi:septal ring factor EnvC (AmiA/AmiB activator)